MKFGIYRLDGQLDPGNLRSLEELFNRPIEMLSFYRAWNRCRIEDDRQWLAQLAGAPRQVLLTWEPWSLLGEKGGAPEQPEFSLQSLASGRYDAYIRDFARALKELLPEVWLRPMHEMNGNWYPWCGTVNGNSPQDYRAVWLHLRRLFAEEGADAITWVWSPYAISYPALDENALERYFPGEDQLDWTALDGYNWGTGSQGPGWQSFEELFAAGCQSIGRLSAKPLMIAETGCAESGGAKDRWISEAYAALAGRLGEVQALVWFDVDKECDWRIESSPESLAAFRAAGVSVEYSE
jgi:hypothetical protein